MPDALRSELAEAQHFAAELVNRFEANRDGLRAMALSADTSVLTAIGNATAGSRGGPMRDLCTHQIEVPFSHTPRVQEGHLLCGLIERGLFGAAPRNR